MTTPPNSPHARDIVSHLHPFTNLADHAEKGPHIFNLGHGITPDADPENVQLMIDTVRNG